MWAAFRNSELSVDPSMPPPHGPIAGTSTAPILKKKSQVDLLFLGDLLAVHAMDASSKNSPLLHARSENPQEVWDALSGARLQVFGQPKHLLMEEGRDW